MNDVNVAKREITATYLLDKHTQGAWDRDCYDELRDTLLHFEVLTLEARKFIIRVLKEMK